MIEKLQTTDHGVNSVYTVNNVDINRLFVTTRPFNELTV